MVASEPWWPCDLPSAALPCYLQSTQTAAICPHAASLQTRLRGVSEVTFRSAQLPSQQKFKFSWFRARKSEIQVPTDLASGKGHFLVEPPSHCVLRWWTGKGLCCKSTGPIVGVPPHDLIICSYHHLAGLVSTDELGIQVLSWHFAEVREGVSSRTRTWSPSVISSSPCPVLAASMWEPGLPEFRAEDWKTWAMWMRGRSLHCRACFPTWKVCACPCCGPHRAPNSLLLEGTGLGLW